MKRALFIDFEDSFTYNVVQELKDLGLLVEVIHWTDWQTLPAHDLLVLGPGPGHPDDYARIFPLVESWLKSERPFFGVCLGHQIFWRCLGEDVQRSQFPIHGQKVLLTLSQQWQKWLEIEGEVWVQRYNSLTVAAMPETKFPQLRNLCLDGEVMGTCGKKIITYQFHPESVGTSFRKSFFKLITRDLV